MKLNEINKWDQDSCLFFNVKKRSEVMVRVCCVTTKIIEPEVCNADVLTSIEAYLCCFCKTILLLQITYVDFSWWIPISLFSLQIVILIH